MRGLRCYRGLFHQEAEASFQAVHYMAAHAENLSRLTLRTAFLKQGKGCIGQSRAGTGKPKKPPQDARARRLPRRSSGAAVPP